MLGAPLESALRRRHTRGGCGMRHNRNGGRHCCQPPLRRAKDMPVFVTWLIEAFGLPTRSRSWLTSSGVAFHRTAPSCEEPDRSTRLRGPKVRWSFDLSGPASGTEVPRSQNRPSVLRPFLGQPLLRPASLTIPHEEVREPRRAREDCLFRRLFPAGPDKNPKAPPIACRRRSDLWSPAASACRCRLLERPGPPSRSPLHNAHPLRVAEAKNAGLSLWITGISGTIRWNLFRIIDRLPLGCRFVPLRLPPPSA